MHDRLPTGVLDSGIGGLSVLTCLRDRLPGESFLYVADSAHAPYGPQASEQILGRCRGLMDFFMRRGVRAVVLACNTATAAAATTLRQEFDIPIIGMEPAVKPAVALTRSGVIGVLATKGTLDSDRFLSLKDRFARQVEVITVACHGWVESIEKGEPAQARRPLLERYLQPLLARQVDTLILGCTHYPLIRGEIEAACAALGGGHVSLLDTGPAVARELERRLGEGVRSDFSETPGRISFYTSGDVKWQQVLISQVWGESVTVDSLPAQEEPVHL